MAGTKEGGLKARDTNLQNYGPNFYRDIGAVGGTRGHTGGFADGEEGRKRARKYGAIGGSRSRRPKETKLCSQLGCVSPHHSKGMCAHHYNKARHLVKKAVR